MYSHPLYKVNYPSNGEAGDVGPPDGFVFVVSTLRQNYYLCAPSEVEREGWIESLRRAQFRSIRVCAKSMLTKLLVPLLESVYPTL